MRAFNNNGWFVLVSLPLLSFFDTLKFVLKTICSFGMFGYYTGYKYPGLNFDLFLRNYFSLNNQLEHC